jgi:hypothetical protein
MEVVVMSDNKPVLDIVVRGTGEVTNTLNEGDRILRKRSTEHLQSTVEILPDAPYIKTFIKPLSQLSEIATGQEMLMIYYLMQYLSYDSGLLLLQNGRYLTRSHIAEDLEQSERQVDRTLDKLKENEVLKRVLGARREVSFIMNPWLFMKGKRINRTLYDLFKNSRWAKVHELKPTR